MRVLRKFQPDIIGITGSVGKTSAKDAIYEVLRTKFHVGKSVKSYNDELGLPLSILGTAPSGSILVWSANLFRAFARVFFSTKYYEKLVLEMGANKKGDLQYLVSIAPPHIAVVTNVAPAHLEFFGDLDGVYQEKSTLVKGLSEKDVAVLNYDDPRVKKMAGETKAKILFFSASSEVDVWANKIKASLDGLSFTLHYDNEKTEVFMKVIEKRMVYSALAATACGVIYGMDLQSIAKALEKYEPPKGRANLVKGIKKTIIIDDTYNANPESMSAALSTLNDIARDFPKSRRVVALGDMREMGETAENFHRELGKSLKSKVDLVVAVGPMATYIYEEAKKFLPENSWYFTDSVSAAKAVGSLMVDNDIILVKGSRGIEMERIVERISNS